MTSTGISNPSDLFPGFSERRINTNGAEIFVRTGGTGKALLLLHGYPQTHAMWHRVTTRLAEQFTIIAADLRGYGRSSCPPTDMEHRPYSKRTMARDMLLVMRQLGHDRFSVMGHDRGGRVAYRLALDYPDAIDKLVILDIISTSDQWSAANQSIRLKMFHWAFLAQPAPMPEALIGNDPMEWLNGRLKRGTKARSLDILDHRAVADYRSYFRSADHIHATCEDFRAGAGSDLKHDEHDLTNGHRINCPTLMLWAKYGPLADLPDPLALWRPWCSDLQGAAIDAGHFLAEEKPEDLLALTEPFLANEPKSDR